MCGRFANHVRDMHRWMSILKHWPAQSKDANPVGTIGFNIAPTQQVPVVCASGVYGMRWGLVPAWSKQPVTQYATFNARLETAAEKPAFRSAWKSRRRCLVPLLGYYEWLTTESGKQPYFVSHAGCDDMLAMAGLWEQREDSLSFTVLTESAQGHMLELHQRMPVFLSTENAEAWLRGEYDFTPLEPGELRTLLNYYPVSKQVNNVRNQGNSLIEPVPSTSESD